MKRQAHRAIVLACAAALTIEAYQIPPRMPILDYIKSTWKTLTRSHANLAAAAVDPKSSPLPDGRWPVYVGRDVNPVSLEAQLRAQMTDADFKRIQISPLPQDWNQIRTHGLLYLPYPYVVPGGRFNEIYGWDSFFIQMGLLRDGEVDLARNMVENFLYEIREYGKVLNANRTYYLSRSQPPFLTEMVLAVFNRTHDRKWLESAVPSIEAYYRYWTLDPHLTPATGLSRYFDSGAGPAPEVLASEHDAKGRNDYDLIRDYFRTHKVTDYDASQYYDAAKDQLTPLFIRATVP